MGTPPPSPGAYLPDPCGIPPDAITAVPGIRVGHATDPVGLTGCTAILCPPEGAVVGVAVVGGAPGTRETDLCRPGHLVERAHAILLTGGSAYGLAAADGVMRWLEEQGVGFPTGAGMVPIVPAAVIYDLGIGDPKARPDAAMGYRAAASATDGPVAQGCVGVGTGATVGKLLGPEKATKAGLGTAAVTLASGVVVGALAVVNAAGNVRDPDTGRILAGARGPAGFLDITGALVADGGAGAPGFGGASSPGTGTPGPTAALPPGTGASSHAAAPPPDLTGTCTTLACVATNAALSKEQVHRLALMATAGLARTLDPAFTPYDGDTVFALACGPLPADLTALGAAAAQTLARAVVRAVLAATGAGGLPAAADLPPG